MKFAAIDIGSNAVRLLFMQAFEFRHEAVFKRDALFRVPMRLGEEVFVTGRISPEKNKSCHEPCGAIIVFTTQE